MNATETQKIYAASETRYNGKCRSCGAKWSRLAVRASVWNGPVSFTSATGERFEPAVHGGYALAYTCQCGARRIAKPVQGKHVATKACNGTCLNATGHDCECACGGRNHGAKHV